MVVPRIQKPREWVPPDGTRVLRMLRQCSLGLDLGQKRDPSAIAVIESREVVWNAHDPVTYNYISQVRHSLIHVERIPLGTPYPRVVERVREVQYTASGSDAAPVYLCVDGTGVGPPVLDLMRERGLSRNLMPVTITSGKSEGISGRDYTVPKRDLITGLQVAFETRLLEITDDIAAMDILISELMSMRVTVSSAGNEKYAAACREGAHDDIVLAVALAWWGVLKNQGRSVLGVNHRLF